MIWHVWVWWSWFRSLTRWNLGATTSLPRWPPRFVDSRFKLIMTSMLIIGNTKLTHICSGDHQLNNCISSYVLLSSFFTSSPVDEEVGDKDGNDDGGEGQEDLGTAGMQRSRCQIFVLKNDILILFQMNSSYCRSTTTTSSTSSRSLRRDTTTSWTCQGDTLLIFLSLLQIFLTLLKIFSRKPVIFNTICWILGPCRTSFKPAL